jgi:hypothetical protein
MDQCVKEAKEIKLHLDNINGEEGLKRSIEWNPSTSLLRHSNTHHTNHKKMHITPCQKENKFNDNRDNRLSSMVTV